MFFYRYKQQGFTLVEIITIIALISIFSVFLISNVKKNRVKSENNVRVADIDTIRLALEEYRLACGEYPEKLEPDVHNGCRYGKKLSDFLEKIPVDPSFRGYGSDHIAVVESTLYPSSQISSTNVYLYTGLSDTPGGKCYDYHIGAVLKDVSEGNEFLQADHDAIEGEGIYRYPCRDAKDDFGEGIGDDAEGLYDFRSANTL